VLLEVDLDIKIARRATIDAMLALAGQADAIALVDPGRNLDGQRLVLLDAAGAGAVSCRGRDERPVPWHFGQVCWIEKKPLLQANLAVEPLQVGQVLGWVPGLAPEPWQGSQTSMVGMRILVSVPWAACSSVISRL
jgi:hypothetical protein